MMIKKLSHHVVVIIEHSARECKYCYYYTHSIVIIIHTVVSSAIVIIIYYYSILFFFLLLSSGWCWLLAVHEKQDRTHDSQPYTRVLIPCFKHRLTTSAALWLTPKMMKKTVILLSPPLWSQKSSSRQPLSLLSTVERSRRKYRRVDKAPKQNFNFQTPPTHTTHIMKSRFKG